MGEVDETKRCELDVSVYPEGFGWNLWQKQDGRKMLLGFWFHLWEETKQRLSAVEKQLLAAYLCLQHAESITNALPETLRTQYSIARWIWEFAKPQSGGSVHYLSRVVCLPVAAICSVDQFSSAEPHVILGPVTYISEMPADTDTGLWTNTSTFRVAY